MAQGITYASLKKKYDEFQFPVAKFTLNGKVFFDNSKDFIIDNLRIELCSTFEASVAEFRIVNALEKASGKFMEEITSYADLGVGVSITLGYSNHLQEVFSGFVAGISFGYEPEDVPYILVTAMDVKGLMMSNSSSLQLKAKSYGQAVEEILKTPAYKRVAPIQKISDTPNKDSESKEGTDTVEMVAESDYEFVVKAAKKFNYEFFTEFDTVYFREAKCKTDILMTLGINQGLISFQAGYSITGLVNEIEVRSIDPGTGKLITATQKRKGSLGLGDRDRASSLLKKSKKTYIDPTVTSHKQATVRADSLMEEMRYRFGELDCSCLGIPELRPGYFFRIEGVGIGVSNRYYIRKIVHTLGKDGYRTRVTAVAHSAREEKREFI